MDNNQPWCRVCFNPLPPHWRDFKVCVACDLARQRAKVARPRLNHPSYRSPLQRLDRETDGS